MPVYMLDFTYCLTDVSEEYRPGLLAFLEEVVRTHPLGRMDTWRHQKKEYMRVVHARESPNIAHIWQEIAEESRPFLDMPPSLVQFCVRDATYHPKAGLSPSRG